jgi:signal transduction histidine kinase
MSRMSRLLAALTIAVLIVTAWLLGWLRQRAVYDVERSIQSAAAAFRQDRILHGPGGNTLVHFETAETIVANLMQSTYLRDVVLTKFVKRENGPATEVPIVPFTLRTRAGADWPKGLSGWQRLPLGNEVAPWGVLYLDVDRSVVTSVNWAIGAVGVAMALVLIVLLARLWSQESSLTRTTIELNERRRELIRVERLALAGQLAAGLLHDLRKPVLHVEHAVEDLGEALGDFAGASPALQDMRRQTRLFFQMLADSQFERFVQSDRATEEFVDIVPILEQSLALVRYERRGVEVLILDKPGLPPVHAYPYRLIQLFSNLILNAYQALAGRGKLTLDTQRERHRERDQAREGILITLQDNGPGIPLETLPHIFEPFFTTKAEGQGSGLGLSICKLIVEDMGGRIAVDSRPGGPTLFRVWLPAAEEES